MTELSTNSGLSQFEITGVFWEKQCREKLPHCSFWYEKIVFRIVYIDIHQKKNHVFQKFVSVGVDNIYNNEEMLVMQEMKDFVSKYFLEIKAVVIRTKRLFSD